MCLRTSNQVKSNAPTILDIKQNAKNIDEVKLKLKDLSDFLISDYEQSGNSNMLIAAKKLYETIKLLEDM